MNKYEKIKAIMESEIKLIFDEYDAETKETLEELYKEDDKMEREAIVSIITDEDGSRGKHIQISTDSDAYDLLYDMMKDESFDNRKRIETAIDKKMKFNSEDHYFENEGMGVLVYYL